MSKEILFNDSVLGNAHFSTCEELKGAGLLNNSGGLVFGRVGGNLVEKSSNIAGHALIVGGTNSGKSSCIAIPTLLRWEGAVIAVDIKGELSSITANHRENVYVFNPESSTCSQYDPLKMCNTVDNAQELARSLIPIPENGEPFWAQSAQSILAAAAYDSSMKKQTFSSMIEKLCTTPPDRLIEEYQNSPYKPVKLLSSLLVGMPEKALGGVMAELKSRLLTFGADPNIEKATSISTWEPETLESGASIYLSVSEKMLKQFEGLWTVIISQILRYLSGRPEGANPPVLILLDEFARLGKLPGILDALATLRSRNVHIAIFVQSMAQLDHIYSPSERKIIADNCAYKMVLGATDPETQKYFSDLAGQKTVWVGNKGKAEGRSTAGAVGIIPGASTNKNQGLSQQGTPLIRPEEFSKLENPVLFMPSLHPICVSKAFWKHDPTIAPIVGLTPPKINNRSIKGLNKLNIPSKLIALCISCFFSFLALRTVISYLLKTGNVEPSDMVEVKKVLSSTPYFVKGILFNKDNIILFLFVWLFIYAIIYKILLILQKTFNKMKNAA